VAVAGVVVYVLLNPKLMYGKRSLQWQKGLRVASKKWTDGCLRPLNSTDIWIPPVFLAAFLLLGFLMAAPGSPAHSLFHGESPDLEASLTPVDAWFFQCGAAPPLEDTPLCVVTDMVSWQTVSENITALMDISADGTVVLRTQLISKDMLRFLEWVRRAGRLPPRGKLWLGLPPVNEKLVQQIGAIPEFKGVEIHFQPKTPLTSAAFSLAHAALVKDFPL